jgi:cytochrome c oxidase subunit 4
MESNHSATEQPKQRHKLEGPQKHIIGFIFSIMLTVIAFATVASGEVNADFVSIIIVVMAILQVVIQMAFWMHMKDRGHLYPIIAIVFGVVVVLTMVIMALYWVWW